MSEFLHDAEMRTESWLRRHSPEAIAQLGVWRWKGIQKHAARILAAICDRRVIDFGGADGPLGFGSVVVDSKAAVKTLAELPGEVDIIFTSHTLEHLDNPTLWLSIACERLVSGGYLIVHVPAWTCSRWRKERYANPRQSNGHQHTFCLWPDEPCESWRDADGNTVIARLDAEQIDRLIPCDVELAEYCGDDSIIVITRKL